MQTKSAKAKGRRLQNWVKERLENYLSPGHQIRTAIMGESGADVVVTPPTMFPFSIECKSRKSFKTIYDYVDQAKSHNAYLYPLVIIKQNHGEPLAILYAEDFFKVVTQGE